MGLMRNLPKDVISVSTIFAFISKLGLKILL